MALRTPEAHSMDSMCAYCLRTLHYMLRRVQRMKSGPSRPHDICRGPGDANLFAWFSSVPITPARQSLVKSPGAARPMSAVIAATTMSGASRNRVNAVMKGMFECDLVHSSDPIDAPVSVLPTAHVAGDPADPCVVIRIASGRRDDRRVTAVMGLCGANGAEGLQRVPGPADFWLVIAAVGPRAFGDSGRSKPDRTTRPSVTPDFTRWLGERKRGDRGGFVGVYSLRGAREWGVHCKCPDGRTADDRVSVGDMDVSWERESSFVCYAAVCSPPPASGSRGAVTINFVVSCWAALGARTNFAQITDETMGASVARMAQASANVRELLEVCVHCDVVLICQGALVQGLGNLDPKLKTAVARVLAQGAAPETTESPRSNPLETVNAPPRAANIRGIGSDAVPDVRVPAVSSPVAAVGSPRRAEGDRGAPVRASHAVGAVGDGHVVPKDRRPASSANEAKNYEWPLQCAKLFDSYFYGNRLSTPPPARDALADAWPARLSIEAASGGSRQFGDADLAKLAEARGLTPARAHSVMRVSRAGCHGSGRARHIHPRAAARRVGP